MIEYNYYSRRDGSMGKYPRSHVVVHQDYKPDFYADKRYSRPYFVTLCWDDRVSPFESSQAVFNQWSCTAESMASTIRRMTPALSILETTTSHRGYFANVDAVLDQRENSDLLEKMRQAPAAGRGLSEEQLQIHSRLRYVLHWHIIVIDCKPFEWDSEVRHETLKEEIQAAAIDQGMKLNVDVRPIEVGYIPDSRQMLPLIDKRFADMSVASYNFVRLAQYTMKFECLSSFDAPTKRMLQRTLFGVQTSFATGPFTQVIQLGDSQVSEHDIKNDAEIQNCAAAGTWAGRLLLDFGAKWIKSKSANVEVNTTIEVLQQNGNELLKLLERERKRKYYREQRRRNYLEQVTEKIFEPKVSRELQIAREMQAYDSRCLREKGKPENIDIQIATEKRIEELRRSVVNLLKFLFLGLVISTRSGQTELHPPWIGSKIPKDRKKTYRSFRRNVGILTFPPNGVYCTRVQILKRCTGGGFGGRFNYLAGSEVRLVNSTARSRRFASYWKLDTPSQVCWDG